ncbi:MAG: hypothetical protein KKD18_04240 [Nanoarchaeota archaeon]|nr:hypothetical protein [Nanoarchaeota archaeon]MBU0977600.1 hypothetical protein [Nanoarchaeota archaeon]
MLIELIVVLLGIPVGFLIAYWANDELIFGRSWFKWIMILSVLLGAYFAFQGNWPVVWTCGFVVIVAGVSCWKSFDRAWVKRRV